MVDETDDPEERVSSGGLSPDELFGLLANARRRHVVGSLEGADGPVGLTDLSRRIAAAESDCAEGEVSADLTRRVYLSLYHVHLPKLDDADVVGFDTETNTITPGANFAPILRLLEEAR